MRTRSDTRGSIERRGPTWWLRRRVTVKDAVTGEVRLVRRRERLGPVTELRTQRQARAAADAWIEAMRPEALAPGPRLLAIAYLEQFKRTHLPLMRPTSQAVYRSIIRKHVAPAVAGMKLHDINTTWLAEFMAARAARYERKMLANIRTVILQILRQAVRDGYGACKIDPREVRLPANCRPQKTQRYFTAEDLERIIAASEFPERALWAIMGYAALRAGEALALDWDQIHFELGLLTVRQNAVRGRIQAPKTSRSADDVPIFSMLDAVLRDYEALLATTTGQVEGYLFQSRNGTPWQADDVRRGKLKPLLARLGLAPAGLHAFRHSVPRMLAQRGASIDTIRRVMRHGHSAQTEVYLHRSNRDLWNNLKETGLMPADAQPPADCPYRDRPPPGMPRLPGVA